MKDFLYQLVERAENPGMALNRVREYLQARMLETLQESGRFVTWVFHGGTALRFLFDLARFSEDLDFSLITAGDVNVRAALKSIKNTFLAENYRVRVTLNESRAVKAAFVHFDGLPHELGISLHRNQSLAIKVELDSRPPSGGVTTTSLVRRHILLRLHHHDRATLLAGKIHALLSRPYIKGRDVYDLVWYLTDRDWPMPNLDYLNHALIQSDWQGPVADDRNWRFLVAERLKSADWKRVRQDVAPFLERPAEIDFLTPEHVTQLLR